MQDIRVMYSRLITFEKQRSFFLFGPRGTGKSSWIRQSYPNSDYLDLLDDYIFTTLLADPTRIGSLVKNPKEPIVIDEVQKIPALLDEVHRLIENNKWKFILTGSNARKLRRGGANLLGGRARTNFMYPLTATELGNDFSLQKALRFGTLPLSCSDPNPAQFLKSYIATYLKEEVLAEGLTRNLAAFSRFLECASFSHGQVLNVSSIAQEAHINQKVSESYFEILEDLLLAYRIPVFTRRAKRKMSARPKFYLFDAGLFQSLRPRGPLDSEQEVNGPALEGLLLQDFMALNSYKGWEYQIFFWRPSTHEEVDFVFYGPLGFAAVEVKAGARVRNEDLVGLRKFHEDYPSAKRFVVYGGDRRENREGVEIIPAETWFREYPTLFESTPSS
jgi:predicted AAA+ superfamily ATPase